jgi:hypothetical protein
MQSKQILLSDTIRNFSPRQMAELLCAAEANESKISIPYGDLARPSKPVHSHKSVRVARPSKFRIHPTLHLEKFLPQGYASISYSQAAEISPQRSSHA